MADINEGYVYFTDGDIDTSAGTITNYNALVPVKLIDVEHDINNDAKTIPIPLSPQASKVTKTYIINLRKIKDSLKFTGEIISSDATNTWLRYKKLLLYLAGKTHHPDDTNLYYKDEVKVVWKTPEGYQTSQGVISKMLFKETSALSWKVVTDYTKQLSNLIKCTIQLIGGDIR